MAVMEGLMGQRAQGSSWPPGYQQEETQREPMTQQLGSFQVHLQRGVVAVRAKAVQRLCGARGCHHDVLCGALFSSVASLFIASGQKLSWLHSYTLFFFMHISCAANMHLACRTIWVPELALMYWPLGHCKTARFSQKN